MTIDIPELLGAGTSINGTGQCIDQACRNLVNLNPDSDEFRNLKPQILNYLQKLTDYDSRLRNLLG